MSLRKEIVIILQESELLDSTTSRNALQGALLLPVTQAIFNSLHCISGTANG
jgi:hypothetical protein